MRELANDEAAYRSLTLSWFRHSPTYELLRRAAELGYTLVLTTDHGTTRVKNAVQIIADKNTNTNIRYKVGKALNCSSKNVFVLENGDTLEMRGHKVSRGASIESGVVYVDGLSVTDANPVVLRDRQKLAQDGIITCVVALTGKKRRVDVIELGGRGISYASDDELMADARTLVRETVERLVSQDSPSVESLRKDLRSSLSGFLWSRTHTRPMVIPVIMEV